MDTTFLNKIIEFSMSLGIALFMLWYFMQYTRQKDQQIREDQEKDRISRHEQAKEFIAIIRESNEIHVKSTLALNELVKKIDDFTRK